MKTFYEKLKIFFKISLLYDFNITKIWRFLNCIFTFFYLCYIAHFTKKSRQYEQFFFVYCDF